MDLRDVLEKVYRAHRRELFALALSVTRCPAGAEDAVHEAFARILRLGRVPARPRVYVFRAVRNAALDGRRRAGHQRVEAVELFDGALDPSAAASQRELVRLVEAALAALGEDEREVVVLRLYCDLTFREIAELLDAPVPTVSARYYRALEKIRMRIEDPSWKR